MTATIETPATMQDAAATLTYAELAVALGASDMPDRRRPDPGVAQLTAWAQQGLDRLGLAEVRRLTERTRVLGYQYGFGLNAVERAEFRAIWPSLRRWNTAVDHAFVLDTVLRPQDWPYLAWRRAHGLAPEPTP